MQKNFEAFIGQGEQAQGRSWRLTKGGISCVCEKERKKGGKKENECEEDCFSSCVWRGAHEKGVCKD